MFPSLIADIAAFTNVVIHKQNPESGCFLAFYASASRGDASAAIARQTGMSSWTPKETRYS